MDDLNPHHEPYGTRPIEADSVQDESFGEYVTSSLLSSLESDFRRGKEENGRIYATYGNHEYYLPVDNAELDRLDMNHQKYTMLKGGNLHLAPVVPDPQRILDLGTGTGIWSIDMADRYPSAQVTGTDIAPIQPQWVPPNCTFQIDDMEQDWTFEQDSFDLIHARDLYFSIRDYPRLLQQCFQHCKPGGHVELEAVYPVPVCEDGTLPETSAYVEICSLFQRIGATIATEPEAPTKFKGWMEAAGFVDVVETILRVPSSPWPRSKLLKKVGALELMNVTEGLKAFLLRGYTRELGKTVEELDELTQRCTKELFSNKIHSFVFFYVVYGRKPGDPLLTND